MTLSTIINDESGLRYTRKNVFLSPFLTPDENPVETPADPNVLIVLNRPMHSPPSPIFQKLWTISSFRICADGGANRLYDASIAMEEYEKNFYIPDMIQGDLDSVREDTRTYYNRRGSIIKRDQCQAKHDLDKSLLAVISNFSSEDVEHCPCQVYVYGAFGGRLDHEMAALNSLYRWGSVFNYKIFLYDDETCAFLLPAEICNEIHVINFGDDQAIFKTGEGPNCGIIPLGEPCKYIRTSGFKWDLDGTRPTSFGALVSTSNKVMESSVTIETSHPVIFTAEMKLAPD